jgi:hypothetical protein
MAEERLGADAKAAFTAMLVLAAIAALVDNGALGWLLAPICLLLAWFAIARAPLKHTMLTLMFFALVLENPSENPGNNQWQTPFSQIGALMLSHLKTVVGGWMFFSGMDLMLVAATVVALLRRKQRGGIGTPTPMLRLALLTYATIVFTYMLGKWRGGDGTFAVWQIDRVMYLPTIFLLCQAAFTGPKDYLAVGKVALAASGWRAAQAIYVRAVVPSDIDPLTGESTMPYATTHNDSMLFALGAVILLALLLERAGKKAKRLTLLLLPLLLGGMLANNRRLVWVEIILVFATVYLMTETSPFKRKLNRAILFALPLVGAYVAAGWFSAGTGIFKPVHMIRSAVDSSADTSTAWRDLENFNLVFTLRNFPLMGVGYGHEFWEMWPMPPVEYSLERYVPHNSILGILCYGGMLGWMGITSLWVGGIYFGIRAYHFCKEPLEKAAALASFGSILIYYLQCFGDMGLGSWTGVYIVAPSMAIACKLAVKNGAWELFTPARAPHNSGAARHEPGAVA